MFLFFFLICGVCGQWLSTLCLSKFMKTRSVVLVCCCSVMLLQRDVLSNPVCSVKLSYFVISCAFTTLMEWETVKIYHSSPSDGSENDPNLSVRFDKVSNFAISTTPVKSCRFDSIYMSRSALLPFPRWPYCHVWHEMNPVTNVCCRGAMAMVHGPWSLVLLVYDPWGATAVSS